MYLYLYGVHMDSGFCDVDYSVAFGALPRAGAASRVHNMEPVLIADVGDVSMTVKKNIRPEFFRLGNRGAEGVFDAEVGAVG